MKRIYLHYFFLVASCMLMAAVPGDVNNDGKLDFADYEYIFAMMQNYELKTEAADINFDGEINEDDAELLQMAIRGKGTFPQLLAKTSSAGKISGGGLTVDIPRAAFVSLSTFGSTLPGYEQLELKRCGITQPVVVNGLPNAEGVAFTLEVPSSHKAAAGKPMLLVGAYDAANGYYEKSWHYRLLSVDEDKDLSYSNGHLEWKPQKLINKPMVMNYGGTNGYISKSVPLALSVVYAQEATREVQEERTRAEDDFTWVKLINIFDFSGYRTDHFVIQPYDAYPVETLKAFARELEKAYSLIGEQGFDQDIKAKWGETHIRVNILKPGFFVEAGHSVCSDSFFWGAPVLEFGGGKLTAKDRAESAIHELMHYHHHIYASHYNALWLDEMCTSWSEYLITANPNEYVAETFNDPRAVLNGIVQKSSIFNFRNASVHGYNLVPFAKWLTDVKYPGKKLWPKVFSSSSYKNGYGDYALRNGIREIDSTADIGKLYSEFISDYFVGKKDIARTNHPIWQYYQSFDSDFGHFFSKNGMLSEIQSSGDIYLQENHSHSFSFEGLSAATWRVRFKKPVDYLGDISSAIITFSFPDITNYINLDYYVVKSDMVTTSITKLSDIKFDNSKKTSTITVSMEDISQSEKYSYLGIIALSTNMNLQSGNVTATVDYSGPISVTNQVALRGLYQKEKTPFMKTNTNMTFTPLEDTVFMGAYTTIINPEPAIKFTDVTGIMGEPPKNRIAFNITGTIIDEPIAPHKDLEGDLRWAEFTGKYSISVSKTSPSKYSQSVYFETPGHGEVTSYGRLYTAEDFQPSGTSKLSDLNLFIPDYSPEFTYNIEIEPIYLIYSGKTDGKSVNDYALNINCIAFSLSAKND